MRKGGGKGGGKGGRYIYNVYIQKGREVGGIEGGRRGECN